jgi:hypothetical protein
MSNTYRKDKNGKKFKEEDLDADVNIVQTLKRIK